MGEKNMRGSDGQEEKSVRTRPLAMPVADTSTAAGAAGRRGMKYKFFWTEPKGSTGKKEKNNTQILSIFFM